MMVKKIAMAILLALSIAGCAGTSISDAGYKRDSGHLQQYRYSQETTKELDEMSVIGILPNVDFDEAAIAKSLKRARSVRLNKGSKILLLQSGSNYPDSEMVESMSQYWDISTLSGDSRLYEKEKLNMLLRYTAATGGNEFVIVYWGVIESAQVNLHTKGVSWIPIVGWSLPDEKIQMRVVLKFAVIDVVSGQWKTFQSKPVDRKFFSAIVDREGKNKNAEIEIKKAIYEKATDALFERMAKGNI